MRRWGAAGPLGHIFLEYFLKSVLWACIVWRREPGVKWAIAHLGLDTSHPL